MRTEPSAVAPDARVYLLLVPGVQQDYYRSCVQDPALCKSFLSAPIAVLLDAPELQTCCLRIQQSKHERAAVVFGQGRCGSYNA